MQTISGYAIAECLYESGHTIVYRGQRIANTQPVILKILKGTSTSPETVARFKREYELTRDLDLPGVVRAYALEPVDDVPLPATTSHPSAGAASVIQETASWIMVLEDFNGDSLRRLELSGRLTLDRFLHIALSLAEILEQIHQRHIIHKDINPSNIVFHPDSGIVKIVDFGIATLLSRETLSFRNPNVLEGTLAYISPEQTGRMNRDLDYRTDFYSLGATLYELLSGSPPFQTDDMLELVHQHIARQPPPPHKRLPPDQHHPLIQALSAIILKLMAKNAEDRYQSAYGLKADLEWVREQWTQYRDEGATSQVSSLKTFTPGQHDVSDRFQIVQKLYGREAERATLLAAYERVSQGACELVLITGSAGIGKSALVQELYRPVTQQRGSFASGKFDQHQRANPYSALIQAFRWLIQQLLTEGADQVARWRERLLAAVGANGQILIEVIPELELIVGSQPDVVPLPPAESHHRFHLVFQQFVQVFTQPEHPLILFIDDLQWADSASLNLLQRLLTTNEGAYLLVIGAYRDQEVPPGHPLHLFVNAIHRQPAHIALQTLSLRPLDRASITRMVAETLHCTEEYAAPLAEMLVTKTGGNPFFIGEFLKSLATNGLLVFDYGSGQWTWDMAQIQMLTITDNVVSLVADNIQQLNETTQTMLKQASCIGNQFDLETLAQVSEVSPADAARSLEPATETGLIIPLGDGHSMLVLDVQGFGRAMTAEYKFAHDRIQQAVYSLIPEPEKQDIHWRIGVLLLERHRPEQAEGSPPMECSTAVVDGVCLANVGEHIFDIVHQLNKRKPVGADDDGSSPEQIAASELAALNLAASRRARTSAAYDAALGYLQTGIATLDSACWQHRYALTLALFTEAAEAAALCGDTAEMERLIAIVLSHARTLLEQVRVYEIRIESYIAQNKLLEAVETGLEVLQILGVRFPRKPHKLHILLALLQVEAKLLGKSVEHIATLPEMDDPHRLAIIRILAALSSPSYIASPLLFPLIILKQARLSLSYGNTPFSTFVYAGYGILLCGAVRAIARGYRVGEIALELVETYHAREFKAKTLMAFAHFIYHWRKPLHDTLPMLEEVYHTGLEYGDIESAGYAGFMYPYHAYLCGRSMDTLRQEARHYWHALQRIGNQTAAHYNTIFWQAICNLADAPENPCQLCGEHYDETAMRGLHESANDGTALYYIAFNKLILCLLCGESQQAVAHADEARRFLESATGTPSVPVFFFFDSLARLSDLRQTEDETDSREPEPHNHTAPVLKHVAANQKKLAFWSSQAPENYRHLYHLVEAERLATKGSHGVAREHYDEAIALAQQHRYPNYEALACERAGQFYLSRNHLEIAIVYLRKAYHLYLRWGAQTLVRQLEQRYPFLIASPETSISDTTTSRLTTVSTTTSTSTSSTQRLYAALDLGSIMKAVQAISSEIELDALLSRMMQIVLENAGAERGVLLLEHEGTWRVEAEGTMRGPQIHVTVLQSLDRNDADLPQTILNYLMHTLQPVVLADASREGTFTQDPYITTRHTRSLLCIPLFHQRTLTGMLYLENNLISGAFTAGRVEVLRILASQATISIENARLYAERLRLTAIEHELLLAQGIQSNLLPAASPDWDGLDIECYTMPAREVGGDLYVYHTPPDGRYVVGVGDVSGKGMPAALLMAVSVASFRSLAVQRLSPSSFLAHMDRAISAYTSTTQQNCAFVYVEISARPDGEATIRAANAGCISPLIRRGNGSVEWLDIGGMPLGVGLGAETGYQETSRDLEHGDSLILTSDGVVEANNEHHEMFGFERLNETVRTAPSSHTGAILDHIRVAVESFVGDVEPHDDITIVVVQV